MEFSLESQSWVGHDAAGCLSSARVDVSSSVSDSVFASEHLDLIEFHEMKASQASDEAKHEPLESHKFKKLKDIGCWLFG